MAGFLYFRSGDARPITAEQIAQYRLSYAFTGPISKRPVNSSSPSGAPGVVFGEEARHAGREIGYFADRQTWRKMPRADGRPELWVGQWDDAKPTAGDLEREPLLPGAVAMKLGDSSWLIPTLTEFDEATRSGPCALPAPLDYDEDGNLFTGAPVGAYGELWEAVHPVALGVCFGGSDDIGEPTEDAIRKAAFSVLQANYVVDMPELVAIGALPHKAVFRQVVLACCRGKWLLEALADLAKKNETPPAANGSATSAGEAA